MTVGVSAGVIFFNDAKSLERCLLSIEAGVKHIICIDGRFPMFKYPSDLSDDGSRDVISKFSNAVLVDLPADEITKRNKYLELCTTECLMVIDSDEYLTEARWADFQDDVSKRVDGLTGPAIFNVEYDYQYAKTVATAPRIFYRPNEIRYEGRHNQTNMGKLGDIGTAALAGIKMTQDDRFRSQEYLKKHTNYQTMLMATERGWPIIEDRSNN